MTEPDSNEFDAALTSAGREALEEVLQQREADVVRRAYRQARGSRITATDVLRAYYDGDDTRGGATDFIAQARYRQSMLERGTTVLTITGTVLALVLTLISAFVPVLSTNSGSGIKWATIYTSVGSAMAVSFAFIGVLLARRNARARMQAIEEQLIVDANLERLAASIEISSNRARSEGDELSFMRRWLTLEDKIVRLSNAVNTESGESGYRRPFGQRLVQLRSSNAISPHLADQLQELSRARNAIVHGERPTLAPADLERKLKQAQAALDELLAEHGAA